VLAAFDDGARSLDEVGERTGLTRTVVRAAVEHLVRAGRLETRELTIGCPSGGCGTCASALGDGTPGCGADGPGRRRPGPALVTISRRTSA
jgi:ferredoxin